MNRTTDKLNRDQIIADKVAEVAEEADRVVAVVRGRPFGQCRRETSDEITQKKRTPATASTRGSTPREVATPAFTAVSVLFVLYPVILELFQWMLLLG